METRHRNMFFLAKPFTFAKQGEGAKKNALLVIDQSGCGEDDVHLIMMFLI